MQYNEALEELKTLVSHIERGDISVDALSEKVKRATELLKICQAKLSQTEEDVSAILKELEKKENGTT